MIDHLDDVDADFRAIYGIDDPERLSAPHFFALATRLPFYPGVMQAVAMKEQKGDQRPATTPTNNVGGRSVNRKLNLFKDPSIHWVDTNNFYGSGA